MKLDHIQLAMPKGEEDLARSFFVDLLQMTEQDKPHPLNERGGVWFHSQGAIIHLGIEADFRAQKKAHPAFLIEDLDLLALTLIESEYEVKWDNSLPNRRRFYTSDPFGNRIEFIADGNGFTQS